MDFLRISRSLKTGRSTTISEMTLGTFGGRLFKNFEVSENRLFGDDLGDDFGNFR
jgi:hypothetical protein